MFQSLPFTSRAGWKSCSLVPMSNFPMNNPAILLYNARTKKETTCQCIARYLNSPDECGKTRLVIRNKFVVK